MCCSQASICNKKNIVIYAWYDNELGYCVQLLRVLKKMAGIKYLRLPLFYKMEFNLTKGLDLSLEGEITNQDLPNEKNLTQELLFWY